MASILLPVVCSMMKSHFEVFMEHFDNPDHLQDAIDCSEDCAALEMYLSAINTRDTDATLLTASLTASLSENCRSHSRGKPDVLCTSIATVTGEETKKLGETVDRMMALLEETKQAVFAVKEMRQRVRDRKEHNIERTRDVFNALRKAINEREKQVVADIKKGADKRENALMV